MASAATARRAAELRRLIDYHNHKYYVEAQPEISGNGSLCVRYHWFWEARGGCPFTESVSEARDANVFSAHPFKQAPARIRRCCEYW